MLPFLLSALSGFPVVSESGKHYYFCGMKCLVLIMLFFLFIFGDGVCQTRLGVLTIESHKVYELLGTDIIVVDTLIFRDSARMILNKSKKENFVHAKKIVIGKGCTIDGRGKNGIPGSLGSSGLSPGGPCRDGTSGLSGKPGTPGQDAVSLFLYFDELIIQGNLHIDLTGGDGGDGGKGGTGGDGNPGTKLCKGGNGGNGGNGAAGANGGQSGNLTFASKYGTDLRSWMGEKIIVRLYGGFAGIGGEGGLGGQRGLSSYHDGDQGRKGSAGADGLPGKPGAIFFERK